MQFKVLQSSNQKYSADKLVSSKVIFVNMQNNKIKDTYCLQGECLQSLDCAMKKKTDLEKVLEKMLGISEVLQGRKAETPLKYRKNSKNPTWPKINYAFWRISATHYPLRCCDTVFERPYRCFSIVLEVILSLSTATNFSPLIDYELKLVKM